MATMSANAQSLQSNPEQEPTAIVVDQKESAWYRSMGDTYAAYAASASNLLAKELNSAEAAKYYGIGERLNAIAVLTAGNAA